MIVDVERLLPVTEPVPGLGDYLAIGGGQGLATAWNRGPGWVLETVARSGLRERAGVGLAAASMWDRGGIHVSPARQRDRFIIARNPYQVLEGLAIAAFAVGASRTVIEMDRCLAAEIARMCGALDELAAAGLLGPASVRLVLSDETTETCLGACDMEALAQVPEICRRGAEWFRTNETMVYSVSGDVTVPGVFELPIGVSARMLVNLVAGGLAPGCRLGSVVCEETGAMLTEEQLDLPITYGSGGFVVYGDQKSSRETIGTDTSTVVPEPGRERMVSDPPISSARSAMLFSP
jgi:NADH-quinone oxidoreductase subunit F